MTDFGGGDEVRIEVGVDADEQQARREYDRLAALFAQAFEEVAPQIGRTLARGFRQAFQGTNLTQPFEAGERAAKEMAGATEAVESRIESLRRDTGALDERMEAFRNTLRQIGAEDNLFAGINRELTVLRSNARTLQEALNRGEIIDPDRLRQLETAFTRANQTIFRDVASIQSLLRNLAQTQKIEGDRVTREADRQAQERIQNARLNNSRLVVAQQGENAQLLAETRIAGQRQIQSERQRSRTRIEIARFTFRQIQTFERALGRVLSTTASAAGGAASAAVRGVQRIGNVFRRSNRDLNDGLRGALNQREQALSRSFRRQTQDVSAQVARQSQVIDRFERRASTGLVGAATGRSRLGGLVGGGLAVGGGFVVARQIREGFEETVNLNEAINRSREIFQSASAEIEQFAQSSVENLFLTRSEAIAAASDFGIFGRSAGLTGNRLTEFSTTLTQLTTDLASFNNTSVQDAVTAVAAGLRGEQEPLRRYGILLDQATLRQRALNEGIIETDRVLTPQERVLAAYSEILSQTAVQQGDAARTADDFANSSRRAAAALTTFVAALTRGLVPLAEIVTNAAFPALTALTQFIEGDVSPALLILRDGLIGVGIGLTALLAARAAGEAVQFLGIALRGLLTPVGLLVGLFAAAGAAITIFARRNERFAAVLRGLVIAIREIAGDALGLLGRGLQAFAQILQNQVLPFLLQLARVVGGALLVALSTAARFLDTVIVPAFLTAADAIAAVIVPAVRDLADLFQRFLPQIVAVSAALAGIALVAAAPIATLTTLAVLLGSIFALGNADPDGFFGVVLARLQEFARQAAEIFAGLGVALYDALRPQVERAVQFIAGAFRNIDLGAVASGVLEVVRTVGFVLGRIISDPLFIKALALIVAAAVAVGAKFVQGFAQGVAENLPELARLLGDTLDEAIVLAVGFALSNPATIAKLIFAGFAGSAILRAFRRSGEAGGSQMQQGFASRLRTGSRNRGAFLSGLFGGDAALRETFVRNGQQAAEAMSTSFARNIRNIRRLGGSTSGLLPADGIVSQGAVDESRRRLDSISKSLDANRASGRLLRATTSEVFRGMGQSAGEFGRVFNRNVRFDGTRFRAGFSQASTALRDGFSNLRAQGRLGGQALGGAVLAGFGAVISGQQLAQGSTALGLSGILASAIGAGLATNSPVVAAAVGGLGLVTAAIYRNKEAAKEAAAAIDDYADAIIRSGSVGEAFSDISEQVLDVFRDLDIATQEAFAGFDLGGFLDAVVDGADPARTALGELAAGLSLTSQEANSVIGLVGQLERASSSQDTDAAARIAAGFRELDEVLDGTGVSGREFFDVYNQFAQEGGRIESAIRESSVALQILETVTSEADEGTRFLNRDVTLLAENLDSLKTPTGLDGSYFQRMADTAQAAGEEIEEVDGIVSQFLIAGAERAKDFVTSVAEAANFDFTRILDLPGLIDYLAALGATGDEIDEVFEEVFQGAVPGVDALTDALEETNEELEKTVDIGGLVSTAISELNSQRTDRINSQIENVRGRLDAANDAAQRARESLTAFLTGRYADTAQAQVDDLIGNVGNIGSAIEDALLQGGIRGEAALRSAVGDFEGQLAGIVQAGFDQGLRTQDEFRNLLAPVFGAINEEAGDSAARILNDVDFSAGITPRAAGPLASALERALAGNEIEVGVQGIVSAEANVRRIEQELNAYESQLDVDVAFDINQVQSALQAAGASAELIAKVTVGEVTAAQGSQLQRGVAAANQTIVENQTNIQSQTIQVGTAREAVEVVNGVRVVNRNNIYIATAV